MENEEYIKTLLKVNKRLNDENIELSADLGFFQNENIRLTEEIEKYWQLEQEIGCPLEVVFKALKDGIEYYVKIESLYVEDNLKTKEIRIEKRENLKEVKLINDVFRGNQFVFIVEYEPSKYGLKKDIVYLKDYGKTWWLKGEKDE